MAIDDNMLDVLREIGNIGSSNASSSLATMMGTSVNMGLPKCEMIPFSKIAEGFSSPEEIVAGILVQMSGDLEGFVMMVQTLDSAFSLMEILLGQKVECKTEDFQSVVETLQPIEEIGNILVGSYLSAISSMTGMRITPSIPVLSVDMVMALMNIPAVVYGSVGESALYMESNFYNETAHVKGHYYMVPTMSSYDKLMKALGL